ncbi:hypothetical protein QVD17_39700 [Tagetes erecta]|uniref:Uncharacterized protein n=1 Tax=Tagetes erecta TaxID=13708 RepID=A0AAD8JQI3_TARER|nr:hypothetical protein QVD17_39700 [Tagetes erecta]
MLLAGGGDGESCGGCDVVAVVVKDCGGGGLGGGGGEKEKVVVGSGAASFSLRSLTLVSYSSSRTPSVRRNVSDHFHAEITSNSGIAGVTDCNMVQILLKMICWTYGLCIAKIGWY